MRDSVHLILDEQSVASAEGVTFHLNPAQKHAENPVLLPGEPHEWDSLQVSWPGTVLYSPRDRKFRCWYSGFDVIQSPSRHWFPGYAESGDGIHWTKPKLDQVIFNGNRTNQLKPDWTDWPASVPEPPWGTYILSTVFENPLPDAPPEKRFGSLWWHPTTPNDTGEGVKRHVRKALAYSPDGIRWRYECTPYEADPTGGRFFQDICQLLYEPEAADPNYRVIGYAQHPRQREWDKRERVRHIGMVHGPDFGHLTNAPSPLVLAPQEGIDEELHFASVRKIGDAYLMLFESDRFSCNPIHGDLRLAVSTDGRGFRRVHPLTPLLPTGPKGTWDENLLVTSTACIQEVGDELYIFYFGCPNTYNSFPIQYAVSPERRGSMFAPAYLGLATLPRDRLGYAAGPGSVATHVLDLGSGTLWLNAEGEGLLVTALDERGQEVSQGRLGPRRFQTVYRDLIWSRAKPTGMATLKIQLDRGTKLFSIRNGDSQ